MGGSELITPAQATVMRLSRVKPSCVPRQESITAGMGERNVVAPMGRNSDECCQASDTSPVFSGTAFFVRNGQTWKRWKIN